MQSDTKTKILQHAARLFFTEGFATGIDRVTSECDVAKMSIYHNFQSKAGLVCAVLQDVQAALMEEIRREVPVGAKTPLAHLETACLILCEGMNDPALKVGLTVRALIEFPDPKDAVHQAARQFDQWILKSFTRLCEDASLPVPEQAARQILLIAKGCFLTSPTLGVEAAEATATALLSLVLAQVPAQADAHFSRP